jgi:hypothetical protein
VEGLATLLEPEEPETVDAPPTSTVEPGSTGGDESEAVDIEEATSSAEPQQGDASKAAASKATNAGKSRAPVRGTKRATGKKQLKKFKSSEFDPMNASL